MSGAEDRGRHPRLAALRRGPRPVLRRPLRPVRRRSRFRVVPPGARQRVRRRARRSRRAARQRAAAADRLAMPSARCAKSWSRRRRRAAGSGRALMEAIERIAAEEDARELWLNARHTAYGFYDGSGLGVRERRVRERADRYSASRRCASGWGKRLAVAERGDLLASRQQSLVRMVRSWRSATSASRTLFGGSSRRLVYGCREPHRFASHDSRRGLSCRPSPVIRFAFRPTFRPPLARSTSTTT